MVSWAVLDFLQRPSCGFLSRGNRVFTSPSLGSFCFSWYSGLCCISFNVPPTSFSLLVIVDLTSPFLDTYFFHGFLGCAVFPSTTLFRLSLTWSPRISPLPSCALLLLVVSRAVLYFLPRPSCGFLSLDFLVSVFTSPSLGSSSSGFLGLCGIPFTSLFGFLLPGHRVLTSPSLSSPFPLPGSWHGISSSSCLPVALLVVAFDPPGHPKRRLDAGDLSPSLVRLVLYCNPF